MFLAVLANINYKLRKGQWLHPNALKSAYKICERGSELSSGARGTLQSQLNKPIIYWQQQQCCNACPNFSAQEGSDASEASSKEQGPRYCGNDNCKPLIIIMQVR
jgi:hypothetical protein